MTMRKSILLIIVGFLAAASVGLAACTCSAPPSSEGPVETPSVESTEVLPVDATPDVIRIRWFIPQGDGVLEERIAEEFNASQSKIELAVEIGPGGGDSAEALGGQLNAGNPPDIVGIIGPRDANKFPGLWLGVDELLATVGTLDDFEPAALGIWQVEGDLIGVPVGVYPSVLFYNRDLFDAAGLPYPPHEYGEPYADGDAWTIEKLEEIGMQLTLDADGNNALDPDFDSQRIVQWGFDWGGDLRGKLVLFGAGAVVNEDGRAEIPEHWREAIHQYYDGMWKNHFITNARTEEIWTWNSFDAGVVAMGLDPTWYPFCCAENTNWDIAAVPSYQGTTTARMECDMVGILRTTDHPREAAEAAYAIASSLDLNMAWGAFPARKSLQPEFLDRVRAEHPGVDWQVAQDGLAHADIPSFDTPMPNYFRAWDRMEDFVDLLKEKGDLDIDFEIETLESDLQTIFNEDG
jgi:multiple sugar transport system substrate-binding protein